MVVKNKNLIKNTFTVYQIKKMIGKKLIILFSPQILPPNIKTLVKNIKAKILENKRKNTVITFTVVCIKGILYVIKNMEYFLAINSISYKEIDKLDIEKRIGVVIHQYPFMTKSEIKKIINS